MSLIYGNYIEEAKYGTSTNGFPILVYDPYALSVSRIMIYAVISLGILLSAALYVNLLRARSRRRRVQSIEVLIVLSFLSMLASGLHHIDNFARVNLYFLPKWIYNGYFFILDIVSN